MGKALRAVVSIFLFSAAAQAQSPAKASGRNKPSIVIEPNRNKTEFYLPDENSEESPEPAYESEADTVLHENPTEIKDRSTGNWERPAFGLFVGVTNNGITRSLFKRTEDRLLKNKAKEQGIGLGLNLDFGMPGTKFTSLRFQSAVYRVQVKAPREVRAAHAPTQLEDSETLLHFALLYRWAMVDFVDVETFWLGFGGQMNYVFLTGRPGNSATPAASKLKSSYGISPLVGFGTDIPLSSFEDLSLSFLYMPPRGWTLQGGFRTSL